MELENLKRKISEDINTSQLRIDCIYYVLKDIYRDVEDIYNQWLIQQQNKPFDNSQKEGENL